MFYAFVVIIFSSKKPRFLTSKTATGELFIRDRPTEDLADRTGNQVKQ